MNVAAMPSFERSHDLSALSADAIMGCDALPSVLILDDDREVAETVATMARSLGSEVRFTCSATAFFREWTALPADVVIMDLQMPGRDGLDVMAELGAMGAAQIILISGCDTRVLEAARHSARINGLEVVGILPKPIRRSVLKEVLAIVDTGPKGARHARSRPTAQSIDAATLETAILERQIRAYFQPKVRLRDGSLYGFEALARWEHPDWGIMAPDDFIPLVSRYGLDLDLCESMIDQALALLSHLNDKDLTMAINATMQTCADPSFPARLDRLLTRHGMSPAHLILEITETGPLEIDQRQIDALTRLRLQGCTLSIDDFGTGVSSLERLVRIPFNELKIDRFFGRDMGSTPSANKLVQNLVRIAGALDMSVTVEGIEDEKAMQLAEKLGCNFGQGYHIAKPMPVAQVRDWISGFSAHAWA